MSNWLLLALLALPACLSSCPFPEIVNNGADWTQKDLDTLQTARRRCGEIWPDAPCLKRFEKTKEGQYRAVCGKNQ